jgi:hypothetical protein
MRRTRRAALLIVLFGLAGLVTASLLIAWGWWQPLFWVTVAIAVLIIGTLTAHACASEYFIVDILPAVLLFLLPSVVVPILLRLVFHLPTPALVLSGLTTVILVALGAWETFSDRRSVLRPIWRLGERTLGIVYEPYLRHRVDLKHDVPLQPAGRVPPLVELGTAGAATAAVIVVARTAGAEPAWVLAAPWGGPVTVVIALGVASFLAMKAVLRWLTPSPRDADALWRSAELARRAARDELTPDEDRGRRGRRGLREVPEEALLERDARYVIATNRRFSLARPMSSPSARQTQHRVATDLGLVLDAVWPRIRWVLPAAQRREIGLRESAVAVHRVLAAALLCIGALLLVLAPVLGVVAMLALGVGALLAALTEVAAARRSLAEACARRAHLVELHRLDLLSALGMKPPHDSAALVRLGGVLTGDEDADYPLAVQTATPLELSDAQLAFLRDDLAGRFAHALSGTLQGSLEKGIRDLETGLASALQRSLEESVTGPPLRAFTGFLVVSGSGVGSAASAGGPRGGVSIPTGDAVALELEMFGDQRAAGAVPERGSRDGSFVALQPIHIPGDQTGAAVRFEIVVDSPTLTATPHRFDLRVAPETGATRSIHLRAPDHEGRHEAWIQLFQLGRLIEVIVLPIEVGAVAPEPG